MYPDKLWLTIGAKYEYNNDSTGSWQPSGRVIFKLTPTQSIWGAVSRSYRMPYSADTEERIIPGPLPQTIAHFTGTPVDDEKITAFEIGHRNQVDKAFSYDLAVYYNILKNLNYKFITGFTPPNLFEAVNDYRTEAKSYGGEIALNWDITNHWALRGSYTYFLTDLDVPDPETWQNPPNRGERHLVQLHSNLDLMETLHFDTHLYWNNAASLGIREIPKYCRLDIRLAWNPVKTMEIALIGEHLLDNRHIELINSEQIIGHETEIPRRAFLNFKWEF